jgi:hypothetical protein
LPNADSDSLWKKLDEITLLLEDLLILQLLKMQAKSRDIRALLKVDIRRVNRISRIVKKATTTT